MGRFLLMNEYKKAVVARLRELEDEFRANVASYSRAEIARKVFDQLFYVLDDAGMLDSKRDQINKPATSSAVSRS